MPGHSRRTFLKVSGAALGGLAVGSTVTAATSAERFIVDTKKKDDLSGVEVIHDLRDEVGIAVVRGSSEYLDDAGLTYEPDLVYELDLPVDKVDAGRNEEASDEPLSVLQWDKEAINAPEAQSITQGEGARVAIIDSGVAAGHPDLAHAVNTDLSRNFTGDGYGAGVPAGGYHGTHVAGIVAANDQNDAGIYGVAPATEIVDCRVFSTGAGASFGDIFAAMVYSANVGCDVANLSLGAYPIPRQGLGKFYGGILNQVTRYCSTNGTLLTISAGNDGASLQHDGSYISLPNEAANVLSISATGPIGFLWGEAGLEEPADTAAFYTNYGTNAIDLSAPGGNADLSVVGTGVPWYFDLVLSTVAEPIFDETGAYVGATYGHGWAAGTSMASPQVAGVAALVASQNPRYNTKQVRNAVLGGVDKSVSNEYHGRGFLDAYGALQ